ncbi:MAG: hypothetical protein GXO89_06860, partial [Chlorobi bacterium]|nr:hypothetical protein [Chlorobiota bacterium]
IDIVVSFNIICNEEEKPGYFFSLGAVGEFVLRNVENMEEKTQKQYILYTALPMVINSVRIFVQNLTSMFEFGPYLLPTIDLTKLINSKNTEIE